MNWFKFTRVTEKQNLTKIGDGQIVEKFKKRTSWSLDSDLKIKGKGFRKFLQKQFKKLYNLVSIQYKNTIDVNLIVIGMDILIRYIHYFDL